jgi:hypothetical protein
VICFKYLFKTLEFKERNPKQINLLDLFRKTKSFKYLVLKKSKKPTENLCSAEKKMIATFILLILCVAISNVAGLACEASGGGTCRTQSSCYSMG